MQETSFLHKTKQENKDNMCICSLLVNMALKLHKPFAVVPCCVFPRLFAERRTRDGKEVLQYNEFIEYLMVKDSRIQMEYLPFDGRNKVLYVK